MTLDAARKLALSLPEAEERDHFGSPSFRVKGNIFAQLSATGKAEQRATLKLPLADQTALILSDLEVFSSVPQWGKHGWTYVRLDGMDATAFKSLLRQAWALVAPKKLTQFSETATRRCG
ncbi:MAG: MmcQ/YjbR family DNA-binding protein [Rhodanobacteraceae bacterium]